MDRFHESVTRLPQPPIVFGSDYSVRPMPGQQGLALAAAGYREATPEPTPGCRRFGCWPNATTGRCNRCGTES